MQDDNERSAATRDNDEQSQATDTGGQGQATAETKPQRMFVDGRWMTAEELVEERAGLQRRLQEQEREEAEMGNQRQSTREPAWAQVLRESGTDDAEVQRLIAEERQATAESVRSMLHSELGKLSQQASEAQRSQAKAISDFKRENPEFDQTAMNEYLAGDPVAKEGFDAFNAQGKYHQAIDYAWTKRLTTRGPQVSERSRQTARVPNTPASVRQSREEEQKAAGTGSRRKIPQEVLDAVNHNADEASILRYMQHRRTGTALDLEAEPPARWNPSRR